MSSPSPSPPRRPFDAAAWRPDRRGLWWALAAFAVGLVVFVLVIRGRGEKEFFTVDTDAPAASDRDYAPLPAPLPAGEGTGLPRAEAPVEEAEVETEVAEAPLPPPRAAEPAPREVEPARPAAAVASRDARPIQGQTPPPTYPVQALRRGEGGTALVIVHVGPDGVPTSTELAQSSGSRDLDRTAQATVRRWRFEPAIVDGRPTVSRVIVPIDFRLDR